RSSCGRGTREPFYNTTHRARDFAMANLNRLSATEAARKLAPREITAQALLADCIERIREREPVVHAWTHLDFDGATKRARQLVAMAATGFLHGLPVRGDDQIRTV